MKTVELVNSTSPTGKTVVKVCDTFLSRLLGLMFTKAVPKDGGIILDGRRPSRVNSAIHMFFMNYPITVLWLSPDLVVVDKAPAKPWVPAYIPKAPARYIVELHAARLDDFSVGDQLALAES